MDLKATDSRADFSAQALSKLQDKAFPRVFSREFDTVLLPVNDFSVGIASREWEKLV